jgi:hypothetical protein
MAHDPQTIPKYMTIGQFTVFAGISRWQTKTLIDKHHIPLVRQGVSKMLDVALALSCLEKTPQVVHSAMLDPRPDLIERLRAAVAADYQQTEEEPQTVA